jgi:hypothetical protein
VSYIGDFNPSDVFNTKFTTVTASGAPATFTGSAAVSVYKANSITQSTAGVTLTVDFDGLTGTNNINVDTSADGAFYAAGGDFQIVATAGTAGGISIVGYVLKEFSIQHRSPLRPTTAGRALDVTSGGAAGIDWANVEGQSTAVTLSATSTLALEPTTAARKLDVTAAGNAGIDWGNVESPTAVNNLSSTNISTSQNINTVAAVTLLSPGAIVTSSFFAGSVDAAALNADAVTKIWTKAMAELASTPAATGTALQALTYLFMALRNARATTATTDIITNDAGSTIATATVGDNGTTFSKSKYT